MACIVHSASPRASAMVNCAMVLSQAGHTRMGSLQACRRLFAGLSALDVAEITAPALGCVRSRGDLLARPHFSMTRLVRFLGIDHRFGPTDDEGVSPFEKI